MRMLAIDTSSEACSVALFEGDRRVAATHETIGRGHAERLVPMISALPDKGRADEIRVSLGPGSFTGVRIGLAAARALGLAWSAPVTGFGAMALLAAIARAQKPGSATVCINGGHGEWFVQTFGPSGEPANELRSLAPGDAAAGTIADTVIGNRAADLAELANAAPGLVLDALPDAKYVSLLGPAALSKRLSPIYGRAPDARKPQ